MKFRWNKILKDQILWKHVFMRDFGGIKKKNHTWEESVFYNEKEKNSYNTSHKQLIWAIKTIIFLLLRDFIKSILNLFIVIGAEKEYLYT